MPGNHLVLRGDARRIPLADGSVDLIVTSPPYFSQRSYRDAGGHYNGQIGSESHPRHWLEAMYEVMKECWRVLAPGGSVFVNLGDKRAGSGGHNNNGLGKSTLGLAKDPASHRTAVAHAERMKATRRNAPDRYKQAYFGRRKSRQLLPERFAIGCEDGLADPEGIGWIVRQIIVWQKANGLPESVTDRTRDDFEYIYHLTKSERYFAAIDEIREPQTGTSRPGRDSGEWSTNGSEQGSRPRIGTNLETYNPLGKVPGSVWRIASEPLRIPDYFVHDDRGWRLWGDKPYGKPRKLKDDEDAERRLFALSDIPKDMKVVPELIGLWRYVERRLAEGYEGPIMVGHVDHFAAYPSDLPRRLILGFSPSGICTACNEPRRPVIDKQRVKSPVHGEGSITGNRNGGPAERQWDGLPRFDMERTITGYACRCTPYTDHKGKGGSGPTYAESIDDGSYPEMPDDLNGKGRTSLQNRPKVGPHREYHFAGWTPPPIRNAVVLDIFGGTGTTALVAETLGRTGISLDLSADYCNIASWRIEESGHGAKAEQRTWGENQQTFL